MPDIPMQLQGYPAIASKLEYLRSAKHGTNSATSVEHVSILHINQQTDRQSSCSRLKPAQIAARIRDWVYMTFLTSTIVWVTKYRNETSTQGKY